MSGTDLAYAATRFLRKRFEAHRFATCLRACYAMSGTDLVFAVVRCYAMSGTDQAYAVLRCYAMSGTSVCCTTVQFDARH
eukprot:1937306-Rhodomonas_salina.2